MTQELIRDRMCELCEDELAIEPYRFCFGCYRKWLVGYNEGKDIIINKVLRKIDEWFENNPIGKDREDHERIKINFKQSIGD
jgi:hypothetical protein